MAKVMESAALAAGRAIMTIHSGGPAVQYKPDSSPVTEADEEAERLILSALKQHFPTIPIVAEEAVSAGDIPDISGGLFFLVDPLDGTKEFVAGRNEFTVNIALIRDGSPVAGIVLAPALSIGFLAAEDHAERFSVTGGHVIGDRKTIGCRGPGTPPTAVASRSHDTPETARFLEDHGIGACTAIGSSLKFCLVAEGLADVYPRFSRTMEWDTAAGDAVLRAAGGETRMLDGRPLLYGKRNQAHDADFANPNFIAASRGWSKTSESITK
ncbi:3'(2'),5'-bisphosphate nucleotidase CysQ [Shinella kummerowiae]|uniref:3'(2'),5'-bisphosphate nucleotidase CysQ n=1 Tax=Shinella kummerowiae TaxID=417745 RepID=A0A6N8SL90_9HYPH|nr:3'(2'),5'-bisphosphate nucleotidase CysQ [Shinella kummerowiae]MXN49087.1 3'(2'),5'-bisphosphate nucleotidase CysQ [Shinella kummerowiae]